MMDGGNSETHRGASGGLADVGAMLRDRRVELKHDIETVAAQTHIKISYLKAIEEGRRRDLPGTAYTIGFVRTYADYLGFDGNRLVNDFHAQLAGDRKRAAEAQAAATEAPRVTISPVAIAAGVLALALVGFFVWGYLSDTGSETDQAGLEEAAEGEDTVFDGEATEDAAPAEAEPAPAASADAGTTPEPVVKPAAEPTVPDPAAAVAVEDQVPPPEADAAPISEQDPAQVQEAAATEGGEGGKIVIQARLESWVQVTNDKNEAIFSRVLRAGETYTVPNEPGLVMTTGNAGGIEIVLDGKKLKSLGSVGLVRRNVPLDPQKLRDGSAFKASNNAQSDQ